MMSESYPTTDEIVAQKMEDGKEVTLTFSNMGLLASGLFSNVYRGTATDETNTSMEIVIKKTWLLNRRDPMELKILRLLGKVKHKNVVQLLYSYQKEYSEKICLGLVFECIPYNLYQFIKEHDRRIDLIEVKLITWQLFRGQAHLQRMQISHRDIHPRNLLYEPESGLLKIADFGKSTDRPANIARHNYHVTRFYRPPELILGSYYYGPQLDIWSCGCIFGELLKGGVFLAGSSGENQGHLIFDMIGVPTKEDLRAMEVDKEEFERLAASYTPDTTKSTRNMTFLLDRKPEFQKEYKSRVHNNKIGLPEMEASVRLLRKVLVHDPTKRLCGKEFLMDDFFDQLFDENCVRWNNKRIECISEEDLQNVKNGDRTDTHETATESNC